MTKSASRKAAPSGYYTAKEAMDKLRMAKGTFFYQVKTGKIEKTTRPGKKEGVYDKTQIDKIAQENAIFTLVHSIEPITFSRVETEEDIRGIVDLCISIYGQGGTPNYDARREIWLKNPESYYIVKQEGIVTGYISLIWFDDIAIQTLMGPTPKYSRIATSAGTGVYSVTGPEHINRFVEGQPIDNLFVSLGVRPGLHLTEQREYAFKLLRGTLDVLINFAERGMPVRQLLATSERGDGIRLARKFKMTETKYPGDNILRYTLDLEKTDHFFFRPYREALDRWKKQHES